MSKGIMDLLPTGQQDDPERDVLTSSLKKSLVRHTKGYKELAYGPANI